MRLFLGFDLSNPLKTKIKQIQEEELLEGRNVSTNNMHLTMLFLGEVSFATLNCLQQAMSSITFKPFVMQCLKVQKFRDLVVIAIKNDPWFIHLHKRLVDITSACGLNLQVRKFYPHITIARKYNLFIDKTIYFEDTLLECHLYESKEVMGKRVYTKLYTIKAKV